jgi:hypothetical protein
MVHAYEKGQQDARLSQFIPIKLFSKRFRTNKFIIRWLSVHTAYSISCASMGYVAANMIRLENIVLVARHPIDA